MIDLLHTIQSIPAKRAHNDSQWCMSRGKRCFDLALSIPAIVAFAPVMAVVAILIKLTSKGPALFLQERVGLYQQPFTIVKFRTMTHVAQDKVSSGGPTVTRRGDPRMTSIGGILRRLKLDELPQLLNVITGDMSLVGPRPKLAHHEKMYLTCRPGVTGAATIAFAHEESMLAEVPENLIEEYAVSVLSPIKRHLDSHYVASATFGTDLDLLVRTVWKLKRPAAVNSRASMPVSVEIHDRTPAHGFWSTISPALQMHLNEHFPGLSIPSAGLSA